MRPPLNNLVKETLLRAGPRMTRCVAAKWGDVFPFWYVAEYPRSGGTWLANMVADYLHVPFARFEMAPLAMPCVLHVHWRYDQKLGRTIYIYRDGRDVMVSLYWFRMGLMLSRADSSWYARGLARQYAKLYGRAFDPNDIVGTSRDSWNTRWLMHAKAP